MVSPAPIRRRAGGGYIVARLRIYAVREGRGRALPPANGPPQAWRVLRRHYQGRTQEILSVLLLDSQNNVTAWVEVSRGGLNTTRTLPREIFRPAILQGAAGIILAHNHPSGSSDPSYEDVEFTSTIRRAGELLGIELYDHLILTGDGYTSLREKGLL